MDDRIFREQMGRLSVVFAQMLVPELLNEYWRVLSWVPNERFVKVINHAIDYHKYMNIPKPSELRAFVNLVDEPRGLPAPDMKPLTPEELRDNESKGAYCVWCITNKCVPKSVEEWRAGYDRYKQGKNVQQMS